MKRTISVLTVLASLVLAPNALAHHPVGTATQTCDTETGNIVFSGTFVNEGFVTEVAAADSNGADLGGPAPAPFSFTLILPGPDRPAGTVDYEWTAANDSGSVVAPYDAVTGCEAPPPPPTTTTTTPPPPPPDHHSVGGPPSTGESSPPPAPQPSPPGVQSGKLPFSGLPLGAMALIGLGLLGAGVAVRKAQA